MALQIDAPETISLVERISKLTGESEETTAEIALRERLERLQPEDEERKRQRLQALADSLAARFKASGQPLVDHGELLYGEDGMPRWSSIHQRLLQSPVVSRNLQSAFRPCLMLK